MHVHDELHSQLRELVRALNPSVKYNTPELDAAALAHLGRTPAQIYGVWVYYPWSRRLVHLLDEPEFVLVRTDRNRNKITREEQAVLATKKVGVIGLSVGQSICLTMALERSFGELRIADFDILELSNLNRIRSGVQNMGLRKTVMVAREVAEVDPFLHVTLFNEGVDRANIERFLTENGTLDILVDECDSVDVKIFARQRAKALGIPVVMDTSDRGMIDVERFDLEPERPILHGMIDHLDPNDAAKAKTNEEKLPFVVPILGLDTLSKRMKASMLEIESTVTTWPQLATSVVLGGALGGDVCRRIALGTFTASGRWFVDPESLMPGVVQPLRKENESIPFSREALTTSGMRAIAAQLPEMQSGRGMMTDAMADDLITAGALAPSAGNLQPWRFMVGNGRLLLFHDAAIGDSALDSGRLIPAVDMGTCLENMRLKAATLGLGLHINAYPIPDDHRLVAVMDVDPGTAPVADPLAMQIGARCTNRRKGDGRPIPSTLLAQLAGAATGVPGCLAHFITERHELMKLARIISEAERIRVLNPIGHRELFHKEMRWTPEEAKATRDGLDIATLELKLSEQTGFAVAADREAMDLVEQWNGGGAFTKLSMDGMRAASAVVLITSDGSDARTLLNAGRALERVWLTASELGLAAHPVSAPILLAHHIRHGNGIGFSAGERKRLLELFNQLQGGFSAGNREPVFMLRLSFSDAPSVRSLRKPTAALTHSFQPINASAWNG